MIGKILPLVYSFFLALVTYWGIWNMYFQQDEWIGFGRVEYAKIFGYSSLFIQSGSHVTPLTTALMVFFYNIFGLNHVPYALYSVLLHAINGYFVYLLAKLLFKNTYIALLSVMFFITLATPQQAVTWYAASLSFLPSAFFSLAAMIIFERSLILALFLTVIAMGFRENAMVLLAYFFIRSKRARIPLFFLTVALLLLRFIPTLFFSKPITTIGSQSTSLLTIVTQFFRFEFFYLPQIVFPEQFIRNVLPTILGSWSHFIDSELALHVFYASIWFVSACTFVLFGRVRLVWLFSAVLAISIVPFTLLPPPLIVEPRHFYLSAVFYAVLLSSILFFLLTKLPSFGKYIVLPVTLLYILLQVNTTHSWIEKQSVISTSRIAAVNQLKNLYVEIPGKLIILDVGDSMPFQTGTGNMFLYLYHKQGPYYQYLWEKYLQDLDSQGYKEMNKTGFGYFTDWELFTNAYCANNLRPENVLSFAWDHIKLKLVDTTSQIKNSLPPRCPGEDSDLQEIAPTPF